MLRPRACHRLRSSFFPYALSLLPLVVCTAVARDVVISEIMFDPIAVDGTTTTEYIELYNPTDSAVSIDGWKVYDGTGKAQATLPSSAPTIAPQGFMVIAGDSTLYLRFPWLRDSSNVVLIGKSGFSLNADGDDVVLRTPTGTTVDSVSYLDDWHWSELSDTKGVSLERISATAASNDDRNWSSSLAAAGGTPGAPNSRSIPVTVTDARLDILPATLSPDEDGFEDVVRISYRLPAATSRILVTVYDRIGRFVRRIADNEPSGPEGELIWDGYGQDARPLEPGIYIVRIEAYDDGGAGLMTAQRSVVIARAL